jgi:hypothetical protein
MKKQKKVKSGKIGKKQKKENKFKNFKPVLKVVLIIALIILLCALIIAPAAYFLFSTSGDLVFSNSTESTPYGVRPTASSLYFDFNEAAETTNSTLGPITVVDKSIYNNYGTLD